MKQISKSKCTVSRGNEQLVLATAYMKAERTSLTRYIFHEEKVKGSAKMIKKKMKKEKTPKNWEKKARKSPEKGK